jgi:PAS domain S-box-containing protein
MTTSIDLAARLSAVVTTQQEVLAAITDLDKVMSLVVDRVPEVTSGSGAVLEIVDGDQLEYRAASGIAKPYIGLRLTREGSLSGLAVKEKSVMRCDDAQLDPRVDATACFAIGIRSMIIAPLLEGDVAVGALKSYSSQAKAFDDLDIYALQLLAGMASGALTQARTFHERQESEARYRLLFDQNVAGVFRTTLDGRVLDVNEALVRYLGYDSRDELLARPAWDLYHQRSDREEFLRLLRANRAVLQIRIPLRRKDGSSLLGVVNASLLPGDSDDTQLLGTVVEA